jgi:hypothetical protein
MGTLGRFFKRIFLWTYERGTVPYDLAVGAILVFVLLTPRNWFSDRPQLGLPSSQAGVVLIADDSIAGTETFQVDPRMLALPLPEPELERLLHDAVRKNVPDLKGRSFEIVHFTPVMGPDGQVKYYEVKVKF